MRKLLLVAVALCLIIVPAAFAAGSPTEKTGASALSDTSGARTPGLGAQAFDSLGQAPKQGRLRTSAARSGARRAAVAGDRHRDAVRKRREASQAANVPPQLQAIAACESGGDPHAIGGGGTYRGKYQFDQGTWASVGGSGDPAAAPEAEQDKRAAMLYERSGAGQWPVCGQ